MKKKVFLYVEYEYITGMTIIYYYPSVVRKKNYERNKKP
jgi:hypothetical protein